MLAKLLNLDWHQVMERAILGYSELEPNLGSLSQEQLQAANIR